MGQEQFLSVAAVLYAAVGGLLVLVPKPLIALLGLPKTDQYFYVRLLGAGMIGTAMALFMEGTMKDSIGLAVPGLIAVTLSVVALIFFLLIVSSVTDRRRGRAFLWVASFALFFACFLALTTLGK